MDKKRPTRFSEGRSDGQPIRGASAERAELKGRRAPGLSLALWPSRSLASSISLDHVHVHAHVHVLLNMHAWEVNTAPLFPHVQHGIYAYTGGAKAKRQTGIASHARPGIRLPPPHTASMPHHLQSADVRDFASRARFESHNSRMGNAAFLGHHDGCRQPDGIVSRLFGLIVAM